MSRMRIRRDGEMIGHYFHLAWRHLRRAKALTIMAALTMACGIGASMTMLTLLHVMSGDPLPERSGRLFHPWLDPTPRDYRPAPGIDPADDLTYPDAMNLLREGRARQQAAMAGGSALIWPSGTQRRPLRESARYVTADFFPMFAVPFAHGSGWNAEQDQARARVAVISAALSARLFGRSNGTGGTLHMQGADFRVIGIVAHWRPAPNFYAEIGRPAFGASDQVFVPLSTAIELQFDIDANQSCWHNRDASDRLTGERCTWLQFWAQLDDSRAVAAYRAYLLDYTRRQHAQGRFEKPPQVRLYGLMAWLEHKRLVPSDLRLQTWLALSFLLVCMVNTTGLLLAGFLRRASEIGTRRALGASRRDVFVQLSIEAILVGALGGACGLVLALAGLGEVRRRAADYAAAAHLDGTMLLATIALSVAATWLSSLVPAWRGCQAAPAQQLRLA